MRDFSKISPAVWSSKRFNNLATDDAKLALIYLMTSEHQTSAGCYRLPDAYAAADLRWSLERFQKARAELVAADLVLYDPESSVVMVRGWFRHNPPMNSKHLKGIRNFLERLPSQQIWKEATAELEVVIETAPPHETAAPKTEVPAKSWANWRPKKASA
jgi:hypothetical protein